MPDTGPAGVGLGAGWEAGDPKSSSARRLTLPTPAVPDRVETAGRRADKGSDAALLLLVYLIGVACERLE